MLAVALLPAPLHAQAIQPPQAQQPPQLFPDQKPPTAALRGRVFAADSGQPLRKAQVRLLSADMAAGGARENRLATTDVDGKYEFTALPAGRFTLTATKGGYVSLGYGQTRPFEPGRPIDVLDAQVLDRVDFTLPRGGVITGRLVDEFGEPVSNVMVAAMRYTNVGGRRTLVSSVRNAQTDDLGEYRIYGLAPGDYFVQATSRPPIMAPRPTGGAPGDRSGYATTFFPGVTDANDARTVAVGVSEVIEDVSFALSSTRTARVSGTAVDSHGQPLAGMLMVIRQTGGNMSATGAPLAPDGSFTLPSVAPGEYTLRAQTMGDDVREIGSLTLSVTGDDITGLRLIAAPFSPASGRIVMDAAALQQLNGAPLSVMVLSARPGDFFPGLRPSRVADDLTFAMSVPPGQMRFQVTGQPAGFGVHAVRVSGVDVTDEGVEVRAGVEIRDIEIELTTRLTSVSGLVANPRGEAARDFTAIVFSQDPTRWKYPNRYIKIARPDQDGRFKVSALPAGDYYAMAVESIESGRWNDPGFLERARQGASMFSLMDGETKTIDLKLQAVR